MAALSRACFTNRGGAPTLDVFSYTEEVDVVKMWLAEVSTTMLEDASLKAL